MCCFVWNARTLSTYWTKSSRDWNLHNGWHSSLLSCPWLRLLQPLSAAVVRCGRSACQGWVWMVETCFQGVMIKRRFAVGRNTAFPSLLPKSLCCSCAPLVLPGAFPVPLSIRAHYMQPAVRGTPGPRENCLILKGWSCCTLPLGRSAHQSAKRAPAQQLAIAGAAGNLLLRTDGMS